MRGSCVGRMRRCVVNVWRDFAKLPCPQAAKYGHLHQEHDADRLLARIFAKWRIETAMHNALASGVAWVMVGESRLHLRSLKCCDQPTSIDRMGTDSCQLYSAANDPKQTVKAFAVTSRQSAEGTRKRSLRATRLTEGWALSS